MIMSEIILSKTGFLALISLFAFGAFSSLLFRKNDKMANFFASFFSIAGSAYGVIFAILAFKSSVPLYYSIEAFSNAHLFSASFYINKLSAFFIFTISLIALFCSIYGIGYIKHFYKKYNIGSLGFFYNTFILGMLAVVSASNVLFFLLAWEVMTLASYFLVIYEYKERKNIKAGVTYFIMTHIGTTFIIIAFLMLYKFTGSFDFNIIKENAELIPDVAKNIIFLLAFAGFGTKAGVIPFHIWLPDAHPAAPSHVSALMSGVMIKTGIYMMIKIFLDIFIGAPLWWGSLVLVAGTVSALLGVLYALTEHDLKRLLAYHSIENIGIILLGIGSALVFSSLNMPAIASLGLIAALFHTLNHATFKSLLFLSAGSVIASVKTKNMEKYGGLIKFLPYTAFFFLIGAMAISALPPFNGFASEWLTFQSLFSGASFISNNIKWLFILSAGLLALTSGLALACFVKAFGATFLARQRSEEIKNVKESSFSLLFGMAALAGLSLAFGLFSGKVSELLAEVAKNLNMPSGAAMAVSGSGTIFVNNGFASVSAPAIFFALAFAIFASAIIAIYMINKNQKVSTGRTWDCGTDLTPRMEITTTGFSRSIIMIFKGVLRPSKQIGTEYRDANMRYFPESRTIVLGIADIYRSYIYSPLNNFIENISEKHIKKIQSGNINAYILYIFLALLALLFASTI
ncbi:hydrogenase 4 subunit B [Candidatus Azambacteria bacterium]|nr:hydrogenase 4 subunit B [Candidatus Azambacteria bacterium]